MRRLALQASAMAAILRWARAVIRLMLPIRGRPLGPGIIAVFLVAIFLVVLPQAGPPG